MGRLALPVIGLDSTGLTRGSQIDPREKGKNGGGRTSRSREQLIDESFPVPPSRTGNGVGEEKTSHRDGQFAYPAPG